MKAVSVLSKMILLFVCMIAGGCEKSRPYQEQLFADALVSKHPNPAPRIKSIVIFETTQKGFLDEKSLIKKSSRRWELTGRNVGRFLQNYHYANRLNASDLTLEGAMFQGVIYADGGEISTFRLVSAADGTTSVKGSGGTIWVVRGSPVDFLHEGQ